MTIPFLRIRPLSFSPSLLCDDPRQVLRADVLPRTAAHFLTISPKLRGARMVRNIPGAYCEFRAPIAVVDPSGETETREDGKTSLQHVRRGILSVAGDRVVLLFAEMPSLDASHHVLGESSVPSCGLVICLG